MRAAVFKKISGGPIKLKDIYGNVSVLNIGEYIVGFYEMFDGLPGIQFQYFGESISQGETIRQDGNVFNIVSIPTKEQMESVAPKVETEPPDNPNADKSCPKCKGRGKYSFGGNYGSPAHWSVCECVMFKPEPPPKPIVTVGFDEETLKMLKSKTPREWMLVKKHELKKIMETAGIDYSQVEDDRMALYKFLFSIVKDIP